MSDAETRQVYWEDDNWGDLLTERDIHIPASILKCRAVSREFQFSSVECLQVCPTHRYPNRCLKQPAKLLCRRLAFAKPIPLLAPGVAY
eukprot:scaffold217928_cov33-Tisochrysis_lutea.AAC.2